ncbi:MAG: hydantoinase/oxoprolinase N-terminal domain-containing protein [Gammaproteobacteria bacterium]
MNTSPKHNDVSGLRIGIDVGGTNTDAVLMQGREVLATTKQPTSADVLTGVTDAIQSILADSKTDSAEIDTVMVGTTHFVNAFVQRRELQPVAIIRIGLPMTSGILPCVDWPDDLRQVIGDHVFMVGGGSYYTGVEYAPLDNEAIEKAAREIKNRGLTSIAISSVFSPIRPDLEIEAGKIVKSIIPDASITLSHEVGGIGLIERENAAIINSALHKLAAKIVTAFEDAIAALNLSATLYLTQNDGTLMGTETAKRFPVTTCSAGPTNSIRGAAFLSGESEAVVVDIGGTTTDVGVLSKGFARETSDTFDMGGVRTNFSMPDVLSVGLGGGTVVRLYEDGNIKLGPDSVGFRLTQEARVFGGNTLTTTDVAVALGLLDLGDRNKLQEVSVMQCQAISTLIHDKVETAIDQLKTSAAEVPVILVGGGGVLIDRGLKGASVVRRPEHASVANAIGAAIAQVGGRVKRLFDFGAEGGRDRAIEKATAEATENAIAAGADPGTIQVVDIEEYPIPYMQTEAVDVRVRVVGDLLSIGMENGV